MINMGVSIYTEDMLNKNLVEDIRNAIPETKMFIADGEFICSNGDFYDFLSNRHKLLDDNVGLRIWALLSSPIMDTTPYLDMKKYLEENMKPTARVFPVPYAVLNSKPEVLGYFEKMAQTHEGIVVKPNLGYNSKWLKMRKFYTQDVVIMGIKKTDKWIKHRIPATFLIGCYDKTSNTFKRIGDVCSGLTDNKKWSIGNTLSQKPRSEDKNYVYVQPAICLEIQYHQKMENGLRFPKIIRIRFDKRPEDCPLPSSFLG